MITREFAKHLRRNMTEAEQRLWFHLRAHRFEGQKFRRQQPIGPYIVDFVHFGARLVVEADGGQHSGDEDDAVRDAWFSRNGFRILRFWNHDILQNTELVMDAIWVALGCAAPLPQPLSREGRGESEQQQEQEQEQEQ
jgi:very-short-patch-repair endonuclease